MGGKPTGTLPTLTIRQHRSHPGPPRGNASAADRSGLADEYIALLKGAVAHTLYADGDQGLYFRRNLPARGLLALLRACGIVPLRTGARAARAREHGRDWPVFAQTMIGTTRLDSLQDCVDDVLRSEVPGDLIEAGVWRGGAAIFMRGILEARGADDRLVWVCDSFEGLPEPDPAVRADVEGERWHKLAHLRVSEEEVRQNFARYGLLDERVRFVKGWFKDTLPRLSDRRWALIRLDGDMYQSTMDGLTHLYPRLSPGGYLVVDDYAVDACRRAVDDYREANGVPEPLQKIDWTGVYWQKSR
ncbi:MAG: O-methyltransferase [Solirubrobacteraceae bacterium]|jgi:O-methyltransferase|nr:O-methyltransferase [Solirubrobacteraceae bacterium]